jgi:hypothetical protein
MTWELTITGRSVHKKGRAIADPAFSEASVYLLDHSHLVEPQQQGLIASFFE